MSDADKRVFTRDDLLAFLRRQGFNHAANVVEAIIANERHLNKVREEMCQRYWKVQERLDKYEPRPERRFNTGQPSPESDG